MTARVWRRSLLIGAAAGLVLGWAVPSLLGPRIQACAAPLRDNPRLSDAILGAGSLAIYIAEAPTFCMDLHTRHPSWPVALVNAGSWAFMGLIAGAFVAAVIAARTGGGRRMGLAAGALGGIVFGWMLPAIAAPLGQCFAHCYLHEGFLGDLALVGGTALRTIGLLAEAPWWLVHETTPGQVRSPLAIPVSALTWAAVGVLVALAWSAIVKRRPTPDAAV